jgi:hypothetical protein
VLKKTLKKELNKTEEEGLISTLILQCAHVICKRKKSNDIFSELIFIMGCLWDKTFLGEL